MDDLLQLAAIAGGPAACDDSSGDEVVEEEAAGVGELLALRTIVDEPLPRNRFSQRSWQLTQHARSVRTAKKARLDAARWQAHSDSQAIAL